MKFSRLPKGSLTKLHSDYSIVLPPPKIKTVINRLFSDYQINGPDTCHLNGGSIPMSEWKLSSMGEASNNPIQHLTDSFAPLINNLSITKVQISTEKEFRRKIAPRNIHKGKVYEQSFGELAQNPDSDMSEGLEIELNIVAKLLGYGKTMFHGDAYDIEPPKHNASAGYVETKDGRIRISSKGENWLMFQHLATDLKCAILEDEFLDISRRYDQDYLVQVAEKYLARYTLTSREDGGPSKGREIYIASALQYILELVDTGTHQGSERTGINLDIHKSPHILTNSKKAWWYLDEVTGEWILSKDARRWDKGWPWHHIVCAVYTICRLYKVPERLCLFIIALNAAAPAFSRKSGYYVLQYILGVIRSGTGIFVKVNHLLSAYTNWLISMHFDGYPDLGLLFGDDRALATSASIAGSSELLLTECNVEEKVGSQLRSKKGLALVRRYFLLRYGKSVPVLWSLYRNYLFSERPKWRFELPYDWALSKRAQLINISAAIEVNKAYGDFYDKLEGLFPISWYYNGMTDKELCDLSQPETVKEYNYAISMVE